MFVRPPQFFRPLGARAGNSQRDPACDEHRGNDWPDAFTVTGFDAHIHVAGFNTLHAVGNRYEQGDAEHNQEQARD